MFHICRTIQRHFSLRQVKLCIGQRKYKQKFTTQGRKEGMNEGRKEGLTDRTSKRVNSRSLTLLLFHILQNSRKNRSEFAKEKC